MITRIWHGWSSPENADEYELLVKKEVFSKIEEMNIEGYRGMQFLRKTNGNEVAFISMIWLDQLENVKAFVGEDYEAAHIPDAAKKLLSRYDERVNHYEVRHQLKYE